jgi:beta-fructofuranosidase
MSAARPQIHFTVREGWINDPLGLTWHEGEYHLFFQFVPGQTVWGPEQRWGHATSEDLLHWTEGPVALEPGDGDDGVWSGSVVVPPGGPAALFYTTVDLADVQIGRARLARPVDEGWTAWTKKDVVAELPAGVDVVAYRDPYVFHDGQVWRMLMGAGLTDGTATALTYRSDDLETWEYAGLLAERHRDLVDPLWTGAVWECPQLFRLGGRWVLTVSVWEPEVPHYEAYAIGDLVEGRFTAEHWGRLTYGPSYYAGSAFADRDGARGLIYWLRDVQDPARGWASAHSLPHLLELDGTRVVARPHPALAAARHGRALTVSEVPVEVPAVVDVEWDLHDQHGTAALTVHADGHDQLRLAASGGELTAALADRSWTMPIGPGPLRVVLDGPVVEIFSTTGTLAVPVPAARGTRTLTTTGHGHATAHPLA